MIFGFLDAGQTVGQAIECPHDSRPVGVVPEVRVRRGLADDLIFQSIRLGEVLFTESPNRKKSSLLMPINSNSISGRICLTHVSFAKQVTILVLTKPVNNRIK